MACGIATLASNSPELVKVLEVEKNGIIAHQYEPKEIAKVINEFFKNKKEEKLMRNRGRKAYENRYNWQLEEKKLLELFEFNIKKK